MWVDTSGSGRPEDNVTEEKCSDYRSKCLHSCNGLLLRGQGSVCSIYLTGLYSLKGRLPIFLKAREYISILEGFFPVLTNSPDGWLFGHAATVNEVKDSLYVTTSLYLEMMLICKFI